MHIFDTLRYVIVCDVTTATIVNEYPKCRRYKMNTRKRPNIQIPDEIPPNM